jgi:hypothetical protein
MGEDKTTLQKYFCEITQAQFVTKSPQNNMQDDIGRVLQEVERSS